MVVNPERGAVEVKSVDGKRVYVFRLRFSGIAKLQRSISTPDRLVPLDEVFGKLSDVLEGKSEDLDFFMQVLLAALQEFHGDTVRTAYDVDHVIEDIGGLQALAQQLAGLKESLSPDADDQKRRAANPRRAQAKRN